MYPLGDNENWENGCTIPEIGRSCAVCRNHVKLFEKLQVTAVAEIRLHYEVVRKKRVISLSSRHKQHDSIPTLEFAGIHAATRVARSVRV